jgi:hypothetical protein
MGTQIHKTSSICGRVIDSRTSGMRCDCADDGYSKISQEMPTVARDLTERQRRIETTGNSMIVDTRTKKNIIEMNQDSLEEKHEVDTTIVIAKAIDLHDTTELAVTVGLGLAVVVGAGVGIAPHIMEHLQAGPLFWKEYQ